MFGDLIKLFDAVQDASDKIGEARAQEELDSGVEVVIRELLSPSEKWPKGQRTFDVIRQSVGIFDERPDELRQFLFKIGARRRTGKDSEELWELPLGDAVEIDRAKAPTKKLSGILKTLSGTVIFLAAVVAILKYFDIQVLDFFRPSTDEVTITDILKRR